MPKHTFPSSFEFGVATSAFQIEGAWNADGKGPSIWDTFGHTPGNVYKDIPADVATDHYHRFREDVAIMKDIGVDSYRFSLSWPRILPTGTGQVNQAGLDFYRRLIDALLDADITPNATLYHWDLPQTLQDLGGWANRDVANWFGDYAALVFESLGDVVPRWATLNEPIAIWVGYGMGTFAPGIADEKIGKQAMHHALLAHGRAIEAFRGAGSPGQIGLVVDVWQRHPATNSQADRELAQRDEDDSFRFFLEPVLRGEYAQRMLDRLDASGTAFEIQSGDLAVIAQPIDYLGLNVYSRVVVDATNYNPRWWVASDTLPGGNYLTNGMEFYPKAAYDAVFMARQEYGFDKPIYITENGMANATEDFSQGQVTDEERIRYVAGFLEWIAKAIDDGADVRGYYLWSLLDNFEWAAGFSQRFGIVQVDPETQERTLKASAHWYRRLIAQRELDTDLPLPTST